MRTAIDNRTRNPWMVFNITDSSKNKRENQNGTARTVIVQLTIALP